MPTHRNSLVEKRNREAQVLRWMRDRALGEHRITPQIAHAMGFSSRNFFGVCIQRLIKRHNLHHLSVSIAYTPTNRRLTTHTLSVAPDGP